MNSTLCFLPRCASVLAILPLACAHAESTFTENFDGNTWSTQLSADAPSGYTFSLAAGRLLAQKSSTVGNGISFLTTKFSLIGNFTFTTLVTRTNLAGNSDAGIWVNFNGLGDYSSYADIFFFGSTSVNANIYAGTQFASGYVFASAPTVTFKIQRIGETLSESFDAGSGYQLIRSATNAGLTGPVQAVLFLDQEFGSTAAASATFDNFSVVADGFSPAVPEPRISLLMAPGLLAIAALRRIRFGRSRPRQ